MSTLIVNSVPMEISPLDFYSLDKEQVKFILKKKDCF